MGRKNSADGDEVEAQPKKGKGNLIPAVVIAVGLLGGGYLMSSGKSAKAAAATTSPAASAAQAAGASVAAGMPGAGHGPTTTVAEGAIVKLDDITLNLADGRFLKVGLAFQLSKKGKADTFTTESPKALDLAIAVLGDRTYSQLITPGGRAAAKADLTAKVKKEYPATVLDVYFTDFVMQ